MHWIALGDIHESTDIFGKIPDLRTADGVIITGDITNNGTASIARSVIDALKKHNTNILAQPGNMDTNEVLQFLCDEKINLHCQVHELAQGVGLMGVGFSSPTPFNTPGEVKETVLEQWLEETYAKAAHFTHCILAVHEPPAHSRLDRLHNGKHVGSMVIRSFIEKTQPNLVLTGHIHESRGTDKVGQSVVINPGLAAEGGYVRIDYTGNNLTAQLENIQ